MGQTGVLPRANRLARWRCAAVKRLQSQHLFLKCGRTQRAIGPRALIASAYSADFRTTAVADGRVLPGRRLTASMKFRCALKNQERESSESPMLKAFWRVAPSVLLSFFAIWDALVFLRAIVFSSRSSPEVHARRFFFLFAITPPFQERQLVSLMRAKEKPLAPESNVKNATSIPGS
jgi:hypothetical protein